MKLFVIVSIASVMYANTTFIVLGNKNESSKKFIKFDATNSRVLDNTSFNKKCYYKNGIVSTRSCYIQTGNIFVSFKNNKNIDIEKFAHDNNLTTIRSINRLYKTVLFKVLNHNTDIINIVNDINKKHPNLKAEVEWITPRTLR